MKKKSTFETLQRCFYNTTKTQHQKYSAIEEYPLSQSLVEARKQIRATYGLELSVIEAEYLKIHFKVSLAELQEIADSCSPPLYLSERFTQKSFDPVSEAIVQFMMREYDLTCALAKVHIHRPKETSNQTDIYVCHKEEFQEYLRRVQERKHLP